MNINISNTAEQLGANAATLIAKLLREAIAEKGSARLLLSTGASQFDTIAALVKEDVEWSKVEMFHLDEYVALPESHIASFRKYLKERFVNIVNPKNAYFVSGEGDVAANIAALTAEITKSPIDVGVIGIGENAHIAFNDPPADFDTDLSYKVVDLDEKCKNQQVGEGWFATINDVPKQAITMTVSQIMKSKVIVSCVPHAVKATAIKDTLEQKINVNVPATIMKSHPDWNLFIDANSASKFMQV